MFYSKKLKNFLTAEIEFEDLGKHKYFYPGQRHIVYFWSFTDNEVRGCKLAEYSFDTKLNEEDEPHCLKMKRINNNW